MNQKTKIDFYFFILAGDLNIDLRWDLYHPNQSKSWKQLPAFEFLESVGLVNCFKDKFVWTRFPWQIEHIFINQKLKSALKCEIECKVCNESPAAEKMVMEYSDHVPAEIFIEF